jgi:hypothetical protein
VVLPRDPATRPKYPPRKAAAVRITTTWVDAEDSREGKMPHPAGVAGPDGERRQLRRELQERWPHVATVVKPAALCGGATVALASDSSGGTIRREREPEVAAVSPDAASWGNDDDFWGDSSEISRAVVVARPRRVADRRRRRWCWMAAAVAAGLAGEHWFGAGRALRFHRRAACCC